MSRSNAAIVVIPFDGEVTANGILPIATGIEEFLFNIAHVSSKGLPNGTSKDDFG